MLPERRADDLALMLEYLLRLERVAHRLVVQAALNPLVSDFLARL